MAEWIVPSGDPTAVVAYSKRVFSQALRMTTAAKLAAVGLNSESQENFVQLFPDTMQGPGDTIKFDLIPNPVGGGVAGDGVIAGQEVALIAYQQSLTINQLRQSILPVGRMSQQRVPYSMRDTAKTGLANWWKDVIDCSLMNVGAGNSFANSNPVFGTNFTGMQSAVAPDSAHWLVQGQANAAEGSLTSSNTFVVDIIHTIVAQARGSLTMPIKPVVMKGIEVAGVLFLHPLQVKSLKTNFSGGEWGDIFRAAMQGGQITGNPIFTGAIGMIDNVVMHEDSRVPYGDGVNTNTVVLANGQTAAAPTSLYNNGYGGGASGVQANVARAVFVGAQALALAFGGEQGPGNQPLRVKWVEELLDAGNQLRITAGMIWGATDTRFNSQKYASMAVSTWAA